MHEGRLERRIRPGFVPRLQKMARIVAVGLEVALELRRGPLAPRGDGREAVEPWNTREYAASRFTEALAEGPIANRDHSLRIRLLEPVSAQHVQVIGRRPRILILRRQGVAREEEHLLRRVEEPRAAWLARRLLELLEAQRATGAAEERTTEFGREDHGA